MSFQANIRRKRDIAIIDLSGQLVLGEASKVLQDAILGLLLEGERKIMLNLTDVSHLDSAGLGEMCAACANVTNAGGEVRLVTPVRIHDQMEVTKLSLVYADYPDEAAAAQSFRHEPTKV